MKSANGELAANARALVDDWMRLYGKRISGLAWSPEVTAQRIIAAAAFQPHSLYQQNCLLPQIHAFACHAGALHTPHGRLRHG